MRSTFPRASLALVLGASLIQATGAVGAEQTLPSAHQAGGAMLAKGGNEFAVEAYRVLAETPGNLVYSPASLSTALTMTYAGAGGSTAAEMANVLHLGQLEPRVHEIAGNTLANMQSETDGASLRIANSLWVAKALTLRPEFRETMAAHYGAAVQATDFANDPSSAKAAINAWAEESTGGKIHDLIATNLPRETSAVLANAVHFKGEWAQPFSKAATHSAPFVRPPKTMTARFMADTSPRRMLVERQFSAVELPFRGEAFALTIVLPDEAHGLADLEKKATPKAVRQWMDRLDAQPLTNVEVVLPKFEFETSLKLKPLLFDLGMVSAFGAGADFSRMTDTPSHIGEVVHKSLISVDEVGAEAVAVTAIAMVLTSGHRRPPAIFRADHPFLFILRDKRNGAILFMGRVEKPSEGVDRL